MVFVVWSNCYVDLALEVLKCPGVECDFSSRFAKPRYKLRSNGSAILFCQLSNTTLHASSLDTIFPMNE